jgi:hypothetical protein
MKELRDLAAGEDVDLFVPHSPQVLRKSTVSEQLSSIEYHSCPSGVRRLHLGVAPCLPVWALANSAHTLLWERLENVVRLDMISLL